MPCQIRARRRLAGERRALKPLRREIEAHDPFLKRKYVREFSDAFQEYEAVITRESLFKAVEPADILLIGDYHALPIYEEFAEELLVLVAKRGRPPVLAIETVFAEDQPVLDRWQQDRISDSELRRQILFDEEWGFDWEPFLKLLTVARSMDVPVYGLDARPRSNFRRLAERDRHAAQRLKEIRRSHPESPLLVLFGESHLAPEHLPAKIHQVLPDEKVISILQNVDELYWQTAAEKREKVSAVRVRKDVYCVFTATPLEKYHAYRSWIHKWQRRRRSHADHAPAFYNLVDALLSFLNVGIETHCGGRSSDYVVDLYPEVRSHPTLEDHKRILRHRGVPEARIGRALKLLKQNRVIYLAEINLVLAGSMGVAAASREAASFAHHACRGFESRGLPPAREPASGREAVEPEDQFYSEVLEQGIAELGALLIHPTNSAEREDLLEIYTLSKEQIEVSTRISAEEVLFVVDGILMHKDFEAKQRLYWEMPERARHLWNLEGQKREFAILHMGTMLARHLYSSYIEGHLTRRAIRSIFFRSFAAPGAARTWYFSLVQMIRSKGRGAALRLGFVPKGLFAASIRSGSSRSN